MDLYTSCIGTLENFIANNPIEKIRLLDDLVQKIYDNDNHILDQSATWINEIEATVRPHTPDSTKKIEEKTKDSATNVNQITPHDANSIPSLLYSLFKDNFKPQLDTNIPSKKNYSYKSTSDAIEYRFSTQAQRHNGQVRV